MLQNETLKKGSAFLVVSVPVSDLVSKFHLTASVEAGSSASTGPTLLVSPTCAVLSLWSIPTA